VDSNGTIGEVTAHQLPVHASGHHRQRAFGQSSKLQDVSYEIRGLVHQHAARLEAEGHRILKLNIGTRRRSASRPPTSSCATWSRRCPTPRALGLEGHPAGPACDL